jgi:hypothetical protein
MYQLRKSFILLTVFALLLVFAAGCGDKRSAKEALQDTLEKQASLQSYHMEGSLKLHLEADQDALASEDPEFGMVLQMLNNLEVKYHGNVSVDPYQAELVLETTLDLQGMSMNLEIPMIMTEEKLWIKVPAIDFIPELAEMKGKFLELDFQKLSELSGQPMPSTDPKAQLEFTKKIMEIAFKHFGDEFFVDSEEKAVKLPSGVESERIVTFQVTNNNLEKFLTTLLEKALPEVLDEMANSDLIDEATKSEIPTMKEDLKSAADELKQNSAELKNLDVKALNYHVAIDKDGHSPYQVFDIKLTVKPDDQSGNVTMGLTFEQTSSRFNETPKWEFNTPKAEEVIPFDEFMGAGL